MPSRVELQEAYAAFRLPIGSDWRAIKKRYKLLVKAWHPDKQGGQGKEEVEQELKEYNHFYNDVFKVHFESEHLEDQDCACQPVQEEQKERTQEEFQHENSSFQSEQEPEPESNPIDPEIEARSQKRRWQASVCCAVTFVAILAYGFIGGKIKSMLPAAKTESVNSIPAPSAIAVPSEGSPTWRAPYQSVSTPITRTQVQTAPNLNTQEQDDMKRSVVAKETKMQLLQQNIVTLKAQIKIARPETAGLLYRDLGSKEAEMKGLQQDVYYLKQGIGQN